MQTQKQVLVLEDDWIIAADIRAELEDRGWTVGNLVHTLKEAYENLRQNLPDLALVDINLRGETSYAFAEELRKQGTPVVFLSANDPYDLPETLRGCPFVEKPVDYENLQQTMLASLSD